MQTVKHSLIDEKGIQHLLKEYGLSPFSQVQFLTRGLNDTYIVRAGDDTYIYRIYRHRWRNRSDILFELDALTHLYRAGFPVSYPFKRNDGEFLCEIHAPEGLRYGVLFSYTEGVRPAINVDNAQEIGVTLAELHNHTDTYEPAYQRVFKLDTEQLLERPKAFITPVLERFLGKETADAFHEIADHLHRKIAKIDLEVGFCHGDFHNHNMHIADDHIEVFDFDCCGIGFRAYDVAVTWWNLLQNYKQQEEECWDAFLNGYLSERQLADDDMESLPVFISIRRIWLLGIMIAHDDVWGTNWMTQEVFNIFMLQLQSDTVRARTEEIERESDGNEN